jgi:hypothetical protein
MAQKTRKWSNLQGVVEPVPLELSPRETAVQGAMASRADCDMMQLAREYSLVHADAQRAADADAIRSITTEALERLIRDRLALVEEQSGQDTWRGEGWLFSPKTTICPVVKDKAALMDYVKDNGLDGLLSLEYSRLKSLVSGILEAFEGMTPAQRAASPLNLQHPLPGVELYIRPGINRTKS